MVRGVPLHARLAAVLFVGATVVFLLAPLVVVAGASVSALEFIAFPPRGFTLRWYGAVLSSSDYVAAALTSLRLAALVTVTASLFGAGAAIAIHRSRLPGAALLATLFLSPLILPTVIFAIGLLMLWSAALGAPSFLALWLGHSVVALPYVVRTTLAVLEDSDPHLEEAARTMGARAWQRLAFVVLPQCLPGLAAGAFFAFNISFDEAVVALFLRRPGLVTLPIQIYGQIEFSPDPSVAAVSTLMILLTVAFIAAVERLLGIRRLAGA
ncbi:MAG: ABC transporter permease [Rhodospirillaceae bacterium]|nr:ABC transporter permease [Rhodospirillaceae bacterium]